MGELYMNNDDLKKNLYKSKARELAEQTFLAWIQIGLILVSVGFASVGVISYIKAQNYKKIVIFLTSIVADLFTITGFIAVIFALFQYKGKIKNIGKPYVSSFYLPLFIGTMISILGVIALLAILIDTLF